MNNQSEPKATILLIESDDETRPLLIESLRARRYLVIPALNEEDAVLWLTKNGVISINAILFNQVKISLEDCVEIVRQLYRQTELSQDVPTVIIAEEYPPNLEGTEQKIDDNKFIIYLEDGKQLFDFLYWVCFGDRGIDYNLT